MRFRNETGHIHVSLQLNYLLIKYKALEETPRIHYHWNQKDMKTPPPTLPPPIEDRIQPSPLDEKHPPNEIGIPSAQEPSQSLPNGTRLEAQHTSNTSLAHIPSEPVYSIYTRRQKNFIVLMSCLGGLFSPLSSSSILAALPMLADTYSTTISLINLSVTVFMIIQGLAPSIFGDLADTAGRRPAYLVSFLFVLGANIGLALQNSLPAFMILRCLQSAGSSGLYALNSGVVADISTTAERGKYMGAAQSGIMLGPALSPVIGGILTEYLGWRAIFCYIGGLYLLVYAILIPETARKIVGNGSLLPTRWFNRSVLNELARRREAKHWSAEEAAVKRQEAIDLAAKRRLRWPNPFNVLHILFEKDCACIMLTTAIVYASWYTVTTTLATQLQDIYGLNTLEAGLCYLPFGTGAALAVFLNGKLLDWNYARLARRHNLPISKSRATDLSNFPIERARLDLVWPQLYIGIASLICYGWTLRPSSHLAAPLVLTFLVGVFMTTTYNSLNILLVDLYADAPSTASAANNLTRCLTGAAGSAIVQPLIERVGAGWAFTIVGCVVVVVSPVLGVVRRWGPVWREERRLRIKRKKGEA